MMWPSPPRHCVFCHCARTGVPAVKIWGGGVVRCWRCQVCDCNWPLSPDEQTGVRSSPVGHDSQRPGLNLNRRGVRRGNERAARIRSLVEPALSS